MTPSAISQQVAQTRGGDRDHSPRPSAGWRRAHHRRTDPGRGGRTHRVRADRCHGARWPRCRSDVTGTVVIACVPERHPGAARAAGRGPQGAAPRTRPAGARDRRRGGRSEGLREGAVDVLLLEADSPIGRIVTARHPRRRGARRAVGGRRGRERARSRQPRRAGPGHLARGRPSGRGARATARLHATFAKAPPVAHVYSDSRRRDLDGLRRHGRRAAALTRLARGAATRRHPGRLDARTGHAFGDRAAPQHARRAAGARSSPCSTRSSRRRASSTSARSESAS